MKLSIIDKIRLASKINSTVDAVEEGISMKNVTKVILAIVSLLTMALGMAPVQAAVTGFLAAHPILACLIAGISTVLAVVHNPNKASTAPAAPTNVNIVTGLLILFLLFTPSSVRAQTVAPAPAAATLPTNVYGVGLSWNNGASPAIAGTATYSRLISQSSGTYGFTVLDMLPESFNPTVVTTNIGVGVSQKAVTIGPFNVFIPVSTGLTVTGTNTGWNWTGGGLVDYNLKKAGVPTNYHIQPNVRFVKSTANGGSGYQLIFGALFAFGQ